MKPPTAQLAAFAAGLRFDAIPGPVVRRAEGEPVELGGLHRDQRIDCGAQCVAEPFDRPDTAKPIGGRQLQRSPLARPQGPAV